MKKKRNPGSFILSHLPISIVLPVIFSVFLFVLTIFLLVIPYMESILMEYRRQLIHNLTEVATSTMEFYESKHRNGELSLDDAQKLAIDHIRGLRYGGEHKDYFWINDMHPKIIMHPYRTDLDGQDVSGFSDPEGKKLFVEMVKTVKTAGSGFVDYQWQWKDDPLLIAPKLSFVTEFKPWNWIIGTGIYTNDIREEIVTFSQQLIIICTVISLILLILSSFIIFQGIKVENARRLAEKQSKTHQEQLFQTAKLASVGTLVSGVAHEINNPATALMLNAPLLRKMWDDILPIVEKHCADTKNVTIGGMPLLLVKERLPRLLSHIEEGCKRIKEIVTELKDFSRNTPPELKEEVDLNLATQKAVSLITNLIQQQTDHFKVSYMDNIPTFKGNPQKVEQVIINLVVNACQALTDKSQPIMISTSFDSTQHQVMIEVQDRGRGISAEVLSQIRDPFFTTKQNQGNTGLGLAISERIMEDHQGSMKFISEENIGTTVQLRFPVI